MVDMLAGDAYRAVTRTRWILRTRGIPVAFLHPERILSVSGVYQSLPITDPSIQTFDDVGVFGRLKRRWRWMLNGRIELRTRVDIDNAVFT